MSDRADFMSLVLAGGAQAQDIDDYIDRWHEQPGGLALHDYLGMTREEFGRWLNAPGALESILAERKRVKAGSS